MSGAATGAVGLMVAERQQDARFVFVERDPDSRRTLPPKLPGQRL